MSLPSINPGARTEAQSTLPEPIPALRYGTIELACAASDRRVPAPLPPRRPRPLVGALAALLAAPFLVAAAFYTHSAAGAHAAPVALAAAEVTANPAWPSSAPDHADQRSELSAVPIVAPAPKATVAMAIPGKMRAQKSSSPTTSSRATKVMPLPAAPSF